MLKNLISHFKHSPISTFVAIASGVIVLATYILPLESLRSLILSWVVIASAAALLVGAVNLLSVHINKLSTTTGNSLYSSSLIISMILTFTVAFLPGNVDQWIFRYVQIPVESSLMAVLAVTLTYAAARLLGRRTDIYSIIFVASLILTLISSGGFIGGGFTWLKTMAGAGGRGIIIGVGLGTVTTGLRVLLGSDRPYSG